MCAESLSDLQLLCIQALYFPSFVHVALCTLLSEERILSDGKTPQLPLAGVPGVLFRVNGGSRRQLIPWLVPARRDPLGLVFGKYILIPQVSASRRCEWSSVVVDRFSPAVSRLLSMEQLLVVESWLPAQC